ncbi:uncharacterized protein LOC113859881 [Abrus precatorius]|uniref:Uncharacterized protein LOC113859881 n=1 Tax=Abrus precatorius TaxID=3816 RepID=A0A8B8KYB1_ABRPR|nr:uncharacterized protein LOC113859881 [Abrus precatorius]
MKDMPFFLLKNSLGAKMKKGIKTFCNNNGSTSTLNQQNSTVGSNNSHSHGDFTSKVSTPSKQNSPTLEDLILQLELEEEMARKAKLNEYKGIKGRMSCVNNSDILRSARNALNQYPRFSLDGRDAMYRSSFGNIEGRRSVCSERSFIEENDIEKGMMCLPPTLAGESVVWRKPGVVAKLMGLEAMPVPISSKRCDNKEKLSTVVRRQNLRRRFERHDLERRVAMERHDLERRVAMELHDIRRLNKPSCCSKNGYCIMKPVALEAMAGGPGSWQPRRYV